MVAWMDGWVGGGLGDWPGGLSTAARPSLPCSLFRTDVELCEVLAEAFSVGRCFGVWWSVYSLGPRVSITVKTLRDLRAPLSVVVGWRHPESRAPLLLLLSFVALLGRWFKLWCSALVQCSPWIKGQGTSWNEDALEGPPKPPQTTWKPRDKSICSLFCFMCMCRLFHCWVMVMPPWENCTKMGDTKTASGTEETYPLGNGYCVRMAEESRWDLRIHAWLWLHVCRLPAGHSKAVTWWVYCLRGMTESKMLPQWGLPACVHAMEAFATELVNPDSRFALVFCTKRAKKDLLCL